MGAAIRISCRIACCLTLLAASRAVAQQPDAGDGPALNTEQSLAADGAGLQFGGPRSVPGQISEDRSFRPQRQILPLPADRWLQFKQQLQQSHGLQLNIDESVFFQAASESPGRDGGASGLVRVYGQWAPTVADRDASSGMLVYKVENRHRLGSGITPFDLGFQSGSAVPTGTFFSDFALGVTNLYWKQYLFDKRMAVVFGRIDVTDFVDPYGLINPLTHFNNLAFSTNPTIAAPNPGLGVAFGAMLTDQIYVQGGLGDANGQSTTAGFDTFFDDAEYFSYLELGATTSQDRLYLDNVHATFWQTDARRVAGTSYGWGVAVTAQKFIDDTWLPFVRFGYSEGDVALMQTTLSTGIGWRRENKDVAGVGVSWGQPADGSLSHQFTSELFYRLQVSDFLAITPDVQLIVDPAGNPEADAIGYLGIRLRLAF